MREYNQPSFEVTKLNTDDGIMKISSTNINTANVVKSSTEINIGKWNK
jgi:hypothetical protein